MLALLVSPALHAQVKRITVSPAQVKLASDRDTRQLVVTAHLADGRVEDVTHRAQYTVQHANVAKVEQALVHSMGAGDTKLTVQFAGQTVAVPVHTAHAARSVSFYFDALPVLSKLGCSSGSCHGSPHGKGGFRLSLRAFAPVLDTP